MWIKLGQHVRCARRKPSIASHLRPGPQLPSSDASTTTSDEQVRASKRTVEIRPLKWPPVRWAPSAPLGTTRLRHAEELESLPMNRETPCRPSGVTRTRSDHAATPGRYPRFTWGVQPPQLLSGRARPA